MKWMVEHTATNLNRYSVSKEGHALYFRLRGKQPLDRIVEFGEHFFFCVTKRARAKPDLRWKLGTFLGLVSNSNESYVALANGSVVKSRSVARVVQDSRWDMQAINNVKGIPNPLPQQALEMSVR